MQTAFYSLWKRFVLRMHFQEEMILENICCVDLTQSQSPGLSSAYHSLEDSLELDDIEGVS